ncbi:MAG: hypothetical protein ABI347_06350 [Nitrososphaera sp.]|jgi:hypothetical protein
MTFGGSGIAKKIFGPWANYSAKRHIQNARACDVCGVKFDSYEQTEEHRRKSHSEEIPV